LCVVVVGIGCVVDFVILLFFVTIIEYLFIRGLEKLV
jgi:hypothetical protein